MKHFDSEGKFREIRHISLIPASRLPLAGMRAACLWEMGLVRDATWGTLLAVYVESFQLILFYYRTSRRH